MKITPLINNVSFGSTGRFYTTPGGDSFGTNSWLFRDDVDWRRLARYEKNHFCSKNKVNIVQFAASDGSEAYTKIISLLENLPDKNADKFFPIKAYDIDDVSVNAACSGYINTSYADRINLQVNSANYKKYFAPTDKTLVINDDIQLQKSKTLKVKDILKNKVQFAKVDMYNILERLKDNSDTILMCRNVLGYFEDSKVEDFIKITADKLKTGSMFVIGRHDTANSFIDTHLLKNKFMRVFEHVYQKL